MIVTPTGALLSRWGELAPAPPVQSSVLSLKIPRVSVFSHWWGTESHAGNLCENAKPQAILIVGFCWLYGPSVRVYHSSRWFPSCFSASTLSISPGAEHRHSIGTHSYLCPRHPGRARDSTGAKDAFQVFLCRTSLRWSTLAPGPWLPCLPRSKDDMVMSSTQEQEDFKNLHAKQGRKSCKNIEHSEIFRDSQGAAKYFVQGLMHNNIAKMIWLYDRICKQEQWLGNNFRMWHGVAWWKLVAWCSECICGICYGLSSALTSYANCSPYNSNSSTVFVQFWILALCDAIWCCMYRWL